MKSAVATCLVLLASTVHAHVSLTYPPARKYQLDFLDTVRTSKPCGGMKKGSLKTKLPAGQDITVSWHLGYPHQGIDLSFS